MNRFMVILILLVGLLARIPYLLFWDIYYSSDTAGLGLIAQHLLQGDFSIYYWGQTYYGNFDPFLLTLPFKIFGATPAVSHWLPFLFSLLLLLSYHGYLRRITDDRTAHIAALILALSPPSFMGFTFGMYSYVIIIALGMMHLILFEDLLEGDRGRIKVFLFGLLAGFSWFYFRLIIVFWAGMGARFLLSKPGNGLFLKIKDKIAAMSPRGFWEEYVLLRNIRMNRYLKPLLVVINLYNCGNTLLAFLLWMRGDWFFFIGKTEVKLYFWAFTKSSLQMALAVFLLSSWRKIGEALRHAFLNATIKRFLIGFLSGFSPALIGCIIGEFPASPIGIVPLPVILSNIRFYSAQLLPALAGEGDIRFLTIISEILVFSGLSVAIAGFLKGGWNKIRGRQEPIARTYTLFALAAINFLIAISGNPILERSTFRYILPVSLSIPLGIALCINASGKLSRILPFALLSVYLSNALGANMKAWKTHQSPNPFVEVSKKLEKKNIKGGYAGYPFAFYVTFLSKEKTILASLDFERRPSYLDYVRSLKNVALIGELLPENQKKIEIKGMSYSILNQEICYGIPIVYLSGTLHLFPN